VILTGYNQHARTETCLGATLYTTHLSCTFLASNSALSGERPATRRQKVDTAKNMLRGMNAGNKTTIRPVVTCSSESWTLTAKDEKNLRIFERQILMKIFGPVNIDNVWRI